MFIVVLCLRLCQKNGILNALWTSRNNMSFPLDISGTEIHLSSMFVYKHDCLSWYTIGKLHVAFVHYVGKSMNSCLQSHTFFHTVATLNGATAFWIYGKPPSFYSSLPPCVSTYCSGFKIHNSHNNNDGIYPSTWILHPSFTDSKWPWNSWNSH